MNVKPLNIVYSCYSYNVIFVNTYMHIYTCTFSIYCHTCFPILSFFLLCLIIAFCVNVFSQVNQTFSHYLKLVPEEKVTQRKTMEVGSTPKKKL